jgi:hypothetical protein
MKGARLSFLNVRSFTLGCGVDYRAKETSAFTKARSSAKKPLRLALKRMRGL